VLVTAGAAGAVVVVVGGAGVVVSVGGGVLVVVGVGVGVDVDVGVGVGVDVDVGVGVGPYCPVDAWWLSARPLTARPAPVVLSRKPRASIERIAARVRMREKDLRVVDRGAPARARTRCLSASSSSGVATGRSARRRWITGWKSSWLSS
jgi:hypothetical protein